jgi:tRNA (guanine-N7-)-methyltransferase
MSSDHASLTAWHLEKTCNHPGFEWKAESAADWRRRPDDLPETRYQKKGLTQGRDTIFLDFRRKP